MLTITMLGAMLSSGPAADAPAETPTAPATEPTPTPTEPPPPTEPAPAPAPAPAVEPAPAAAPVPPPEPMQPPAPETSERPKRKLAVGGFGAFDLRMHEVDEAFGLTVGAIGGVILANRLLLGGGGYTLVFHERDYSTLTDNYDLHMAYAGGYIGAYALRSARVDGGFGVFLGGGRACMESSVENDCYDKEDIFASHLDGLIYVKLAHIVRLGFILGYHFYAGANDWKGPDDWDLSGFAGTIRLEIGKYDDAPGKKKRGRRGRRG